jgi:hypothetical protein
MVEEIKIEDPTVTTQLSEWRRLIGEAADVMRALDEKGFTVTLDKVLIAGVPRIRTKVIYKRASKRGA